MAGGTNQGNISHVDAKLSKSSTNFKKALRTETGLSWFKSGTKGSFSNRKTNSKN
jgi:hypothetical protein